MSAGQYIRRAAGYFIKLVVLVGLLYLLMFVTGTARVSAEFFFRELFTTPRGILLVAALAVLSAFYPKFGYVSREAEADIVADRDAIINAFHAAVQFGRYDADGKGLLLPLLRICLFGRLSSVGSHTGGR